MARNGPSTKTGTATGEPEICTSGFSLNANPLLTEIDLPRPGKRQVCHFQRDGAEPPDAVGERAGQAEAAKRRLALGWHLYAKCIQRSGCQLDEGGIAQLAADHRHRECTSREAARSWALRPLACSRVSTRIVPLTWPGRPA
jgi:hypothetical protein